MSEARIRSSQRHRAQRANGLYMRSEYMGLTNQSPILSSKVTGMVGACFVGQQTGAARHCACLSPFN